MKSSCGRVNKIPITWAQKAGDHAKANTEKAEQGTDILSHQVQITASYNSLGKSRTVLLSVHAAGGNNHCGKERTV